MSAQSDELAEAQLRLYRTQARWEPYKALAAILGAVMLAPRQHEIKEAA